ncbi:amidohydrolase [Curtobacterium citreum]|uniref:Amidohydrolase family protein n=1 Tax=Curtobacterium citreum TaxID=2036 RepID=A0ABT2HG23_9MICO|nr:amidohydrolase family protein [Curtobacterium citreum]MCS6522185.1 amidohydrolase family protein [Curtobacterium citreum]TQJ29309.1 L-fuconolactonase [Curtobacterium citreum]GGL81198.1 amidohydrolase [Curtobacterium citreum]
MIIDAHHHLWDPSDRPYPWMDDSVAPLRRRFDTDDLSALTRAAGIDRTIVVQAAHDPGETEWLLTQPSPVVGVVGWVDLTAPDVADRLAALVDGARPGGAGPGARGADSGPRLVGIRHQAHDEPDPGWLARPEVVRGVRAVAAAGLAFDLLVRAREQAAALALVDAVPEGRFVLDHAGKPAIADEPRTTRPRAGEPCAAELRAASAHPDRGPGDPGPADAWRSRMRDLAARPNVVVKASGLLTEAGPDWRERPVHRYIRETVEHFGPDRTMWGSDWPVSTLVADHAAVLATTQAALDDLSPTERDTVFAGTATRTYLVEHPSQT